MPKFDHDSANKIQSCDDRLIDIFKEIIKIYDFKVVCGYRREEDQNAAYKAGTSKEPWPKSKHNTLPSLAIDILPRCLEIDGKIDWRDEKAFAKACGEIAELVFTEADKQKVHIRWGGDFRMDGSKTTTDSWDKMHFELYLK